MPRGPAVVLTWTPPEQLPLFVSQNWWVDRDVLSLRAGSSGGLRSGIPYRAAGLDVPRRPHAGRGTGYRHARAPVAAHGPCAAAAERDRAAAGTAASGLSECCDGWRVEEVVDVSRCSSVDDRVGTVGEDAGELELQRSRCGQPEVAPLSTHP